MFLSLSDLFPLIAARVYCCDFYFILFDHFYPPPFHEFMISRSFFFSGKLLIFFSKIIHVSGISLLWWLARPQVPLQCRPETDPRSFWRSTTHPLLISYANLHVSTRSIINGGIAAPARGMPGFPTPSIVIPPHHSGPGRHGTRGPTRALMTFIKLI